jgi:hypothetical protein
VQGNRKVVDSSHSGPLAITFLAGGSPFHPSTS